MSSFSQALQHWLRRLELSIVFCEPLKNDASLRKYFRLYLPSETLILMDASLEKHSVEPFIRISQLLATAEINVPRILQFHHDGYLLIEDFGDHLLLNQLSQDTVDNYYSKGFNIILNTQALICHDDKIPLFSYERIVNELCVFKDYYLLQHVGLHLSSSLQKQLDLCFDFLAKEALSQPYYLCHRDFHSANLMVLPNQTLGVIDFQDAFYGPVTYDLVSLIKDCYVAWDARRVRQWLTIFYNKKKLVNVSLQQFEYWFTCIGLQRHLKALGTFARKAIRDNQSHYLSYIPRTLAYIKEESAKLPECEVVNALLFQKLTVD